MHQDFFRALTYDHHFRQKSAIYCYRLNSKVKNVLYNTLHKVNGYVK